MMNTNNRWWHSPLYLILALFGIYLILKWTCRLLFGLLDYAVLLGLIVGIVWYLWLPQNRKLQLRQKIVDRIKAIAQRFY